MLSYLIPEPLADSGFMQAPLGSCIYSRIARRCGAEAAGPQMEDKTMPVRAPSVATEIATAVQTKATAVKNSRVLPPAQGLYNPHNEHDACGVGFIAQMKGIKSHKIVEDGLAMLENLTHRGAVGADPMGDGAGVLVQIPTASSARKWRISAWNCRSRDTMASATGSCRRTRHCAPI